MNNLATKEPLYIPKFVLDLPSIRSVDISENNLVSLPLPTAWKSTMLKELVACRNSISKISLDGGKALAKLELLNLAENGLLELPKEIGQLPSLTSLDISHNKLTTLPDELGKCSKLWELPLHGLPNLSLDPALTKGRVKDLIIYLHNKLKKATEFYRMKLMLIGYGGRGKSTLLRALMKNFKNIERNQPTVGVIVKDWKFEIQHREKRGTITCTLSTWDFAGQEEFYSSHQCYISGRAIYLVVCNIKKGTKEIDQLKPWLSTIHSRAPGCPVIFVMTHLDQIAEVHRDKVITEMNRKLEETISKAGFPEIKGSYAVTCTKENNSLQFLRAAIRDVIDGYTFKGLPVMGQKIPASYVKLADLLEAEVKRNSSPYPVITYSRLLKIVQDESLDLDKEEIHQAVHFLHESGILLHYPDKALNLNNLYFIDPGWLCCLMAQVVTVKQINPFIRNGILRKADTSLLFTGKKVDKDSSFVFPKELIPQYLKLLENILCLVIDHMDALIDEWYPGLTTLDPLQGKELLERLVPCTKCQDRGKPEHMFKLPELFQEAEKNTHVTCPQCSSNIHIAHLAPDIMLSDLESELHLEEDEFNFEESAENLIGDGGFGNVYKAAYKKQTAEGMAYLHGLMIVYRDMKPDNVLIFSTSLTSVVNAKVSDYGIARFSTPDGLTAQEGTPAYRAPEVIRGETYSFKADVFSLGVTLYTMITQGRHPFDNLEYKGEMDRAFAEGHAPPPITQKNVSPWPSMQHILSSCMQTVPDRRPSSDEVVSDLNNPDILGLQQVIPISVGTTVECLTIQEQDGGKVYLWIACGDCDNTQLSRLDLMDKNAEIKGVMFRYGRIMSLQALSQGFLLVGTQLSKIWLYDSIRYELIHSTSILPDAVLCIKHIHAYSQGADDMIFAGLANGTVCVFSQSEILHEPNTYPMCITTGQRHEAVRCLEYAQKRKRIYASCGSRIVVIDIRRSIAVDTEIETLKTGLDSVKCRVTAMCLQKGHGYVWLGTGGGHIVVLEESTGKVVTSSKKYTGAIRTLKSIKARGPSKFNGILSGGLGFVEDKEDTSTDIETECGCVLVWDPEFGNKAKLFSEDITRRQRYTQNFQNLPSVPDENVIGFGGSDIENDRTTVNEMFDSL
ncbi:hypothetical protein FSP39_021072 [Pinctada imbricata]|uniref:non-specific serine/threonine protein kinase n=1 Tax=Pinctada imbricata TaxID=66713 RepID=A0AA88YL46_PINIB|nr:hypothetical protein FSP39_021072 [Pinctada imbricata]